MTNQVTEAEVVSITSNVLEAKLHKLRKIIPSGMPEEFETMDEQALRKRIVACEANIHDVEAAMDADNELTALKERVKDAKASYTDARKVQMAIAKYCTVLLRKMDKV